MSGGTTGLGIEAKMSISYHKLDVCRGARGVYPAFRIREGETPGSKSKDFRQAQRFLWRAREGLHQFPVNRRRQPGKLRRDPRQITTLGKKKVNRETNRRRKSKWENLRTAVKQLRPLIRWSEKRSRRAKPVRRGSQSAESLPSRKRKLKSCKLRVKESTEDV